jgi:protein TonB
MKSGREYDPPSDLFGNDDPEGSPSGKLFRLMLLPAVVGAMFFGGVYWLRLQTATGGAAPEQSTLVQVHLMPRPDPIPLPAAPATQSAAISDPTPASGPSDVPAAIANQALAALPSEMPVPAEPVVQSTSLPSPTASAPNAATAEFRNALLRHIARFQRYPRAAEREGLQGTVYAVFSISRDGKVLGAWVKTSSGQAVLDRAAIETIRRAQPLPAIPPALPDPFKIELALGFDAP